MLEKWACLSVLFGMMGAFAQAYAFEPIPPEVYAQPQTRVVVEAGRRLNLYCEGAGAPVILLDAGLGGSSYVWRTVQQALSTQTRVCAYDRAGFGFSDATPHPSDVVHIVADLHRLIRSTEIGGPVVYVGHSIAGLYGLRLMADFPSDVAGEVLVDPAVAGQFERATAILPASIKVNVLRSRQREVERATTCQRLARLHHLLAPRTKVEKACVAMDESLDPLLQESLARQYATPAYQAANLSEVRSALGGFSPSVDERQVLSVHPEFGSKPLTVLSAGRQSHAPGVTTEQAKRLEDMLKEARDRIAQLSQNGRSVLVPDSDHFIQIDRPDVVVDEVGAVVAKVRQRPPVNK